ncbi:MAG: alpha/beta hydrolase [Hyphomicrobiales bacterium]|nr:alpha/beta hydrolase [Hyphomicrobiales bacterium]
MFLGGYLSDMQGSKATFLEARCREWNVPYLRMDYTGHGQSGGKFEEGSIGRWAKDVLSVLDQITEGPQILVGSSMGGWIMLLTARARRERICGLLGIASAPDFTEHLIWDQLTETQRQTILQDGYYVLPQENCHDPDAMDFPITRTLIEDGRKHLLLDRPIPLTCPVRLLHGMQDTDVPWHISTRLAGQLESTRVTVTLQKTGDHRMSTPESLALLERELLALLAEV